MKKIDEAMAKNPKLSAQQSADVKKFRADVKRFTKQASTRSPSTRSPRR